MAVVSALISSFFKRLEVRLIDLQLAPAHSPLPQLWPLSGEEKAWMCLEKLCGTWRSGCFVVRMELQRSSPALRGSEQCLEQNQALAPASDVRSSHTVTQTGARCLNSPWDLRALSCVHTRAGHGTRRALQLMVPSCSGEERHRPLLPLCIPHQGSPRADGRSPARAAPKLLALALGFKRKKCHQKSFLSPSSELLSNIVCF